MPLEVDQDVDRVRLDDRGRLAVADRSQVAPVRKRRGHATSHRAVFVRAVAVPEGLEAIAIVMLEKPGCETRSGMLVEVRRKVADTQPRSPGPRRATCHDRRQNPRRPSPV